MKFDNSSYLISFTVMNSEEGIIPPVAGNSKISLTTQKRLMLAL